MTLLEMIKESMNESCNVLVYTVKKVYIGKFNGELLDFDDFDIDKEMVKEIHFFNEKKEVKYVYSSLEDKLIKVELTDANSNYLDEEMNLNRRISKSNKLVVRNYYDYSSDGIIYIKSSRLVEVK